MGKKARQARQERQIKVEGIIGQLNLTPRELSVLEGICFEYFVRFKPDDHIMFTDFDYKSRRLEWKYMMELRKKIDGVSHSVKRFLFDERMDANRQKWEQEQALLKEQNKVIKEGEKAIVVTPEGQVLKTGDFTNEEIGVELTESWD